MTASPRLFQEGIVYDCVQRTVDRQFLFKPDPQLHNIVGACAARAQAEFSVNLHWLVHNSNHEHMGLSSDQHCGDGLGNLSHFRQLFHSLLARELNTLFDREGPLFSSRSRITPCLDDEAAEQQLFYALTNPAKDGLVEEAVKWSGFSTLPYLLRGENPEFTYFDREAWNAQKRRKNALPLEAFEKKITLKLTPLPHMQELSRKALTSVVGVEVKALEERFRAEREAAGQKVLHPERLARMDPRGRPATSPVRTPKPLCHASNPALADAYKEMYREFRAAYRVASSAYLAGDYYVRFPAGSMRPPLIQMAA